MQIKYLCNKKDFTQVQNIESIDFALNAFLAYWNLQNRDEKLIIELNSDELNDDEAIAGSHKENDNTYLIHINKNFKGDIDSLFIVLAHEIVHIKQYCQNELIVHQFVNEKNEIDIKITWKGKDVTKVKYEKRPDEKEANKYQSLMVDELYKEIDVIHEAINE